MMGIKRVFFLAVMVFSLFASVYSVKAATVITTGNVGQLLSDAYILPGGTNTIQGVLNGDGDADLYYFGWNGVGTFSASTTPPEDLSLFLFNSQGFGMWASGDVDPLNGDYSASLNISNLAAGNYYLGVAFWSLDPADSSGIEIFRPISGIVGQEGPNSAPPAQLAMWINQSYGGNYEINLSSTAPVPIPGAIWLLGTGLIGIVGIRRKFKK